MKNKIPYAIIILITTSISVALTNTTLSRNSFFLAAFLLVIHTIISKKNKIELPSLAMSLCILLISANQYTWLYRFSPTNITDSYNQYTETSFRLLTGSILILLLSKINITKKTLITILTIMLIGFIYTIIYSLLKIIKHPEQRLQINTVATMSAYVFLLQSLTALSVISYTDISNKIKNIAILLVSSLSLFIISLTETRSALMSYPALIIIFFYFSSKQKIKPKKYLLILIPVFTVLLCFNGTLKRLDSSFQEISNYDKGKNDSSIGSRISMWKAGINAIEDHPFGQSAYSRFINNTIFIKSHEYGNPEALRNIKFHLHNDIIESSSLQGIFGGLSLILFFITSFYISYREKNKFFFIFLILPTIILGLTDSLFIDYRFVTVLVQSIAIHLLLMKFETQRNQEES